LPKAANTLVGKKEIRLEGMFVSQPENPAFLIFSSAHR